MFSGAILGVGVNITKYHKISSFIIKRQRLSLNATDDFYYI